IPHEVFHANIFVLQLVPCGGRGVLPSRKLSQPQATKQCLPRQRKKPLSLSGSGVVQGCTPSTRGAGGENPPDLIGRQTKESKLKIRVRPDYNTTHKKSQINPTWGKMRN
ncbi:MAG: hypothetical protein MST10_07310, partial [Lentisphaeria bacterium]|nr:hypothetical protein [Lentisphaeria bacterium]